MRLWCGPPASVSRVVHLASCSATLLHWYRKLRYRLSASARATQASLCVVARTQLNDKTACTTPCVAAPAIPLLYRKVCEAAPPG